MIGIMSMQRVQNYGSFLQAYALKEILNRQGHEVKFIDIERNENCKTEAGERVDVLGRKLRNIDRFFFRRIENRMLNRRLSKVFECAQREILGLTKDFSDDSGCDGVLIGSDEIFNCESNGPWRITEKRFGLFPPEKKVISYAASCGYSCLNDTTDEDLESIQKGLLNLSAISVRDMNTYRMVRAFCEDEIEAHLDPALIFDFSEEIESVQDSVAEKEPYMLVYSYRNRIDSREVIKAITGFAKERGLKTISIGGSLPWCDAFRIPEPFQVLAYFQKAECVVTDTFHGTVFGAKYNKPMAVFLRKSNANKLSDLIEKLQIQNCAVHEPKQLKQILNVETDYTYFNEMIGKEKERSEEYLRKAFAEI